MLLFMLVIYVDIYHIHNQIRNLKKFKHNKQVNKYHFKTLNHWIFVREKN